MNRKANLRAKFSRAESDRIEFDRAEFDRKADLRASHMQRATRRAKFNVCAAFDRAKSNVHARSPHACNLRASLPRAFSPNAESNPGALDLHAFSLRATFHRATSRLLGKSDCATSAHAESDLHAGNLRRFVRRLAIQRARLIAALILSGLVTTSLGLTPAMAAPGKPVHHHHLHTAAVPQDAQATAAPARDTSPVVARMGNLELHADQTQKLIANLNPSDRAAIDKNPDLLARVLRGLIADRFVLAQALSKHWDQQPAVAAALERMRENAIMQSYVQAVAAPPPDYPNEADLAEAYEANKSALMAPKQYEVAQIFVAAKTGADSATEAQAREKILAIARELRSPGADFAAIAKTESQAKATAAHGGIIGWLSEAQLRPDIKPHILALTPGAISAPIRLDDGWQILKLVDVHPPRQLDLSEVHDVLKQKMRQQRAQDLQRAWLAELVKANPISLDQSELNQLVGATGAAAQ